MHFLRDLRGHFRRDQHDALGAIIRSIFTARDGDEARRRLRDAVGQLERRLPKVAALLEEAETDVLAFYALPAEHWPKIRSTNPLERFNREIARRTDVVGIFPDDAALIRLVSMLAIEANGRGAARTRATAIGQSLPATPGRRTSGRHSLSGLV